MKRILALLAVLTLFLGSSFAQIQQSGAVATPSATQSILGGVNVAMTNATCNVLTPGSACTLAGTSQSYLVSYYLTYNITSATSAQSLVIPLQPGAEHWVNNTSAFVITAGGSTGTTVAVQPGTDVLIHCPDGTNYVQSAVIGTGTNGTIPLWSGTSSLGNSPLSVANSPTTGGVFDSGTFYGQDVCWHYESGGTPTAACLQYAGHGTYYGPYNTDDGTTFTPTPFSVGQLQVGLPGATGVDGQAQAPSILFYQGDTGTSALETATIAMYQTQPTGACPNAGTPLAVPVWGFAADDTISYCTNGASSAWALFSNGGGSALLLGPVGNQAVVQPAGTSAKINTLGGSGSLGGVDFASQFGSITSAISDASTYTRGVYDDLGTLGGFTNSLTVPVNVDFPSDIDYAHAGAVFPEQWGAVGDGTTDDHTAIQSCWTYAAAHGLVCEMHPKTSYLITSALSLPSGYNIRGTSPQQGITVKSEVNGDAIILQAGPVVGGRLSNFHLVCDPTLASSRGFHIQGSVGGGFSAGGMWNSVWDNVEIDNPSFEGYYSDAGGNSAGGTLPNQFDTFINLTVNGPLQAHPKNLILMTGETIQNTLINGSTQVPNITNFSQYPNPLIELMNATTGLNDGPTNITFLGYTSQEGSICFDATQSFSISFTHGYFEQCQTAVTASFDDNLIIQNNNVQNSGTVSAAFVFSGGVIGKLDDSFIENGGGFPLAQFATCSNSNFIETSGNYSGSNIVSTSCDTGIISVPSSGPLVVQTYDTLVNTSSTPIQNINYYHNAGERLILRAQGGPITLESGGNIDLGGYANPLVIPSGTIVTLKLVDFPGNFWIVESTNGVQLPQTGIFQTTGGSFPAQWQQVYSTNSGLTNGIPAGDNCFISYISNGSGSNVNEIAYCQEDGVFGVGEAGIVYSSHNTAAASPSFSVGPFGVGSFSLGGSALLTSVQGTDTAIMSAGTISGGAGTPVCLDSNTGLTTTGCSSATGTDYWWTFAGCTISGTPVVIGTGCSGTTTLPGAMPDASWYWQCTVDANGGLTPPSVVAWTANMTLPLPTASGSTLTYGVGAVTIGGGISTLGTQIYCHAHHD